MRLAHGVSCAVVCSRVLYSRVLYSRVLYCPILYCRVVSCRVGFHTSVEPRTIFCVVAGTTAAIFASKIRRKSADYMPASLATSLSTIVTSSTVVFRGFGGAFANLWQETLAGEEEAVAVAVGEGWGAVATSLRVRALLCSGAAAVSSHRSLFFHCGCLASTLPPPSPYSLSLSLSLTHTHTLSLSHSHSHSHSHCHCHSHYLPLTTSHSM